ncbi:response regulator transcription factor, partial [Moorena sp. SIO3I8]|uniref:response regulator n=1 Tax=Moorena sp. SIO3I8 TaxID=2607833 RepID=UPI0013C0C2AC
MSDRITHILLIDDDPVFRLGIRTALQAFEDLLVVAEADTGTEALSRLAALEATNSVDLAILELALDPPNSSEGIALSGLPLCQRLQQEYPNLPILLLTRESQPTVLAAAQALGVNGYCPKGVAISTIVEAIGQIIEGQSYWQTLSNLPTVSYKAAGFAPWYQQWRKSGFQQFEAALAQVNSQLQNPRLSNWDWLFWTGRRRELLVARWLADQLLPASIILVEPSRDNSLVPMPKPERSLTVAPMAQSQLSPNGALVERRVERTMVKLQSGL